MHVKSFPIVGEDTATPRQVLADSPELMVVAFTFKEEGAEGALHNHPHVQSTFVKEGRFRFTIASRLVPATASSSLPMPFTGVSVLNPEC
jgi:quercetin dioxygenase-like cupin family protein